jgi:YVTN family beta-propeller protein
MLSALFAGVAFAYAIVGPAPAVATAATAAPCVPPNEAQLGYVPNLGGNTVSIVNLKTNTVIAAIGGVTQPVQATVSNDGSQLFVDDWGHSAPGLAIVDLCTDRIVKYIPSQPGTLSFSALSDDGTTLWSDDFGTGPIYRLDTASDQIVRTYTDGATANLFAVPSPDNKVLYVAQVPGSIETINTSTGRVFGSPIPVGLVPGWVSVTPDGSRLLISAFGDGTVTTINTATRKVIATVHMGTFSLPEFGAISPDGKTFWSSNGDGTVWVISTRTGNVIHVIKNSADAFGVSFDRSGQHAYVTSLRDGQTPQQVCLSNPLTPLANLLLLIELSSVCKTGPGQVSVYNPLTYQRTARFLVGPMPVNVGTAAGPLPKGKTRTHHRRRKRRHHKHADSRHKPKRTKHHG